MAVNPPLPLPGGDAMRPLEGEDTALPLAGGNAYVHDLSFISAMAIKREEENDRFRSFLKQRDSGQVDSIVSGLNLDVSASIDCTRCGNCCRSLMINVLPEEAQDVAAHLHMSVPGFKQSFVEESEQGQLVINSIPCHFLYENKCSIYDYRFHECREFPHLHKPGFTGRLFGTLMHYGRCPIIFNVIESLKKELAFNSCHDNVLRPEE